MITYTIAESKMQHNVFLIDSVTKKIVSRHLSDCPEEFSINLAKGHMISKCSPKLKKIPTDKHPNRWGVLTDSDFFVHFFYE
jgi:hypothetical protein